MTTYKKIAATLLLGCASVVNAGAGQTVVYEVDGNAYEGYYVPSDTPNAPLVMLVHDWDGLTDYEVKRATMLNEMGYSVFAADLFGQGIRPTEVKDKKQHTGELYKDRAKMRAIMRGALATAKEKGAAVENAVAMGYCFGGAAVLELARAGEPLKGFATFHGGLTTPEGQSYADTQGELIVMHGTADKMITMQQFSDLAVELESSGIEHEMISYGGAPHAFTVMGSDRYREKADSQSWASFTAFLSRLTQQ